MEDRFINYCRSFGFICLLVLAGFLSIVPMTTYKSYKHMKEVITYGGIAEANVTKSEKYNKYGKLSGYYVYGDYQVDGKDYKNEKLGLFADEKVKGDTVLVYYDKKSPKKTCTIKDADNRKSAFTQSLFNVFIVLAIAVASLFLFRNKENRIPGC